MSISTTQIINSIEPWLNRVTEQLKIETKKEERKSNEIFRQVIETNRPSSHQETGLTNNYKIVNNPAPIIINNPAPIIVNSSTPVEKKEKKQEKEKKKLNWKEIATITFICTPIASGSVFAYARLAKTEQRVKNYLDKTLWIKQFANTFDASTVQGNPIITSLKTVAAVQEKIDQNKIDEIKGYKYAALAALSGTLTITTGALAMPWFRSAGTIAIIAGIVLGSGSIVYATYNLADHWGDEQEAREQLTEVRGDLNRLEQFIRPSEEKKY